jgi:uncharacterized tellurite resistance protein B-like protein
LIDRLFGADDSEGDERPADTEPEPPSAAEPALEPEAGDDPDLASIRRAISGMESLSRERRRFLAGYAYILVRVARADGQINEAENLSMEQAVSAAGELPETQGALLVALAGRMNALYGTTEDYAVTREFARNSSPQERQRLMRACISVGAADGVISGAEATELYEIGRELGFSLEDIDIIRDQVAPTAPEPSPPAS